MKVSFDWDPGFGCRNVFYLPVDEPASVHDEPVQPDQQYYRVDDVASWDLDCVNRTTWAVSSSIVAFVSLHSQWVPSAGQWEMRFGSYTWIP